MDKKGNIIDKKENVIENLKELAISKNNKYPKNVEGVTITENDKDKMIFKLKVRNRKYNCKFRRNGIYR